MHSRIFRIGENTTEDLFDITESDYYESSFIGSVADYVADDEDRDSSVQWLRESLSDGECAAHIVWAESGDGPEKSYSFKVDDGYKTAYFKDKYLKFLEHAKGLEFVSLAQFVDDSQPIGMQLYLLNQAHEETFGFYIEFSGDNTYNDMMPLDHFIRHIEPNSIYHVGGTLDYHY